MIRIIIDREIKHPFTANDKHGEIQVQEFFKMRNEQIKTA